MIIFLKRKLQLFQQILSEKLFIRNEDDDKEQKYDELIINTLLVEYQNIHERVFRQIEQYEQTNVQTLMLVGVLLAFAITNFSETNDVNISLFVNFAIIIALPVISLCTIILSVTHLIKIMILGDYLMIIENKVNTVLKKRAEKLGFGERVLAWEWWRIRDGYAKKGLNGVFSIISFDLIIIILIVAVTIVSVIIREKFIIKNIRKTKWFAFFSRFPFWFIVFSVFIFVVLFIIYSRRRKKSLEHSENNKVLFLFSDPEKKDYKKPQIAVTNMYNRFLKKREVMTAFSDKGRKEKRSMKNTLIILIPIILIIVCPLLFFGRSRISYNSGKCPEWMWKWAYAHKGIHKDEKTDPNSIGAFAKTIEKGYAIELDLRPTKDKVPMVSHDFNLKDEVGKNINLTTIPYEQAHQLTYLASGEHIASFEDVLSFVDGRVPLLIDIKSFFFPGKFEENIISLLSNYDGPYAIQCFSPIVLNYIKKLDPNITIGLLLDDVPYIPILRVVRIMKDNLFSSMCHPQFITYNIDNIKPFELDVYRDDRHVLLGYLYTEDDISSETYKNMVDAVIFEP